MYFYSFDLLDILFSTQSSAIGAEMLMVLSLGICLLSSLNVLNTALESKGKIGTTVVSLLLGCAVKLAVSYFLIGKNGVGILGAPLGTVVSYAVSLAVSMFALNASGVKTFGLFKIAFFFIFGSISFYPIYKNIYLRMLLRSSFVTMCFSICLSLFVYAHMLLGSYFIYRRKKVG
jgi:stage V sporulation protein B